MNEDEAGLIAKLEAATEGSRELDFYMRSPTQAAQPYRSRRPRTTQSRTITTMTQK